VPATKKYLAHLFLFPLGLALLFAMTLFQEGTALTIQAQSTPMATLSPFERLAEPTLPASPSQADEGAQAYWLLCLPCHGDKGQGLTDEFRTTYPPDEEYCWERGCHGERPYEDGFKLPLQVPAVIGPEAALGKFSTAARLQAFIFAAMPYWNPGSLTEEESWKITAFLLRENGISFGKELDASNADQVLLGPAPPVPTVILEMATEAQEVSQTDGINGFFPVALTLLVILVGVFVLLRRRTVP